MFHRRAFLVAGIPLLYGCQRAWPILDRYPEPLQEPLTGDEPERLDTLDPRVQAIPRFRYTLIAYAMATERYRWDDLAKVSPVDIAFAWGDAATVDAQRHLNISQSGRWFYWTVDSMSLPGLPARHILVSTMANVHMVPSDELVWRALRKVDKGDSVELKGYLVDLKSNERRLARRTSQVRGDTGGGACEIFYVTDVKIY
jgi:hypothetical protein